MYLEHYGLDRYPFQITPDVAFFYDSRVHHRALAIITYGLSKQEGFVVVTGEVGAGKTTLIEYLLAHGNLDEVVTARISTTQLGAENLLELIAGELGLRSSGASKAAHLRDLNSFFLRTAQAGKSTLLIVDEVQNLSSAALEELRMLSNFQNRERPMVQMLLVGQPEFRARLASAECEQIRQRVIASYHLLPLTAPEVPVYIAHRLELAGFSGDALFSEEACAKIHRETGGVPRKINRLCDRILLYGFLEAKDRLDAAAVDAVAKEMRAENLADEEALPISARMQMKTGAVGKPEQMKASGKPAPPASITADIVNGYRRNVPEYGELLETLDDLRREIGEYRSKMDRIMRLVSERDAQRRREG